LPEAIVRLPGQFLDLRSPAAIAVTVKTFRPEFLDLDTQKVLKYLVNAHNAQLSTPNIQFRGATFDVGR
jgi:hypothetical protein